MDPIAVDFPGRAPAAAPRTTIPPVKVDSPRVEPAAETPTTPPPASNGWPKKAAAAFGFGLTKRRLAITAAAVASLAAGVVAVKTFGPTLSGGSSEPRPTSPPASLPLASTTPKGTETTSPPDEHSTTAAAGGLPKEPDATEIAPVSAPLLEPSSTAAIPPVVSVIPAASPAVSTEPPVPEPPRPLPLPLPLPASESIAAPAAEPVTPLPLPTDVTPVAAPTVLPVAASESKPPMMPTAPAVPGIPEAPGTPSVTPSASPALPLPVPVTPEPTPPVAGSVLPTPAPMSPATPVSPITPAGPASIPSPLPLPGTMPIGEAPTPKEPASAPNAKLPGVTPVTPVEVPVPLPPVTPVTPPDSTLPMPRPTPESKLPGDASPSLLPGAVSPMSPVPSPASPRVEFRKADETDLKSAGVAERAPTTSYDVDLYEPRAGENYETISREFYNDVRYARALAEYNQRRQLPGRVPVEVPPIHILKKQYPQFLGNTASTPAADSGWRPASGTSTGPSANVRTAGSPTFVVPQGGMSMPDVAKRALGTDKRWREIYDLNPQFAPDAVPAGAELRLPSSAVAPK